MRENSSIFVQGAIPTTLIAKTLSQIQTKKDTGALDIFLGQIRQDFIDRKPVIAIEYSAYEGMAQQKFEEIIKDAHQKYKLTSIQIFHSLGKVGVGEICLFVLVASPHRKEVFNALQQVVEVIKKKVPIFGKEIFEDESYQWKVNN